MKKTSYSLIVLLFSLFIGSCTNEPKQVDEEQITEGYDAGIEDDIITHELEKERILEKEQTDPSAYLVLNGECKKNLKGEWILKGSLKNVAEQATYSNIQLTAEYYDKLDNLITNSDEVLNSSISPNQKIELKYKLSQKPKKAKKAIVKVKL